MTQHEKTLDLVVVGELNADLILEDVQALPALGTERLARGMTLTLGSSSAILAANASALGLRVGFVGRVGRDLFAGYVRGHLEARGVDTSAIIETPGVATGLTAIYTHGGRRGALTYPGAMEKLVLDDVAWPYVRRARHLHLSSFYLQRGLRPRCAELFEKAKALGLSTSLDTNWDPDEEWGEDLIRVLSHVDVFLPNDAEARHISGTGDLDEALGVLARHAGTVVVKCGAEGVRARRGRDVSSLPALPVDPVDAVGAGDSFNAGFLLEYVRGRSLEACLRHGLLTGAFSTTAAGGVAAFDDMEHFERFAARRQALSST